MVHKQETLKSENQKIAQLEHELKVLELEQRRQAVENEVKSKEFMTRHKTLREGLSAVKSGVSTAYPILVSGFKKSLKLK